VNKVKPEAANVKANQKKDEATEEEQKNLPWTSEECLAQMLQTNKFIQDGAKTFLRKEYTYLCLFCVIFALILVLAVDQPWVAGKSYGAFPYTCVAFIVGAITSMVAGYIGMVIATQTNVKVTYLCNIDISEGFKVAFSGGQVLGFCLVGLALGILEILILCYRPSILAFNGETGTKHQLIRQVTILFEFISGYGLGGSTVALFGRVGGGIYTKAADVGADLAGKVGEALDEDSPLNPGTIADNVGDNVGDIAGMGADLFGSLAESTCAALVVSSTSWPLCSTSDAVYFPLLVTAVGIIASFITVQFATTGANTEAKLRTQLILSSVLMTICVVPTLWVLPPSLDISFAGTTYATTRIQAFGCIMLGLWSGLLIGLSTEYYTSHTYGPTRELARACLFDAATNVIKGLALGYMSCVIPIICLSITVLMSFNWAAMYGVALAALGMLGCLPVCLAIDGYGPISDNAGGIAEMCNLDKSVREKTDELDAAGNTTAAIGKGFAIGSACLVALALFGAYITRVAEYVPSAFNVNILEPFTFAGLLFGAMIPYLFSALTMSAVGDAAEDMIEEIRRQVPLIRAGTPPDHERCIAISTTASLRKMVAPGAIVILSPLVFGLLFGYRWVSGMLAGTIVSGIQIAFSASNTGGAWDNAKKYVEAGKLFRQDPETKKTTTQVKKGDREHAAAVCGDTVGDPLKDTSGPAINILIKLMAITSLVFGGFIVTYGGVIAGSVVIA
jgi:H(+)-translocating pyrophosphatase